ncbi:hypothetical protein KFE25_005445 [Diacronema lutheri]|uniref:Uncharacterized protein n=1 Tax=Diacronema lutheri TaxID=2081491 RepID=A0A8J6CDH4_DIALT|nr:hypothetical protein KFE25_005445 [Diacronema lutheri]
MDGALEDEAFERARQGTREYVGVISGWLRAVTGQRVVVTSFGFEPQGRERTDDRCRELLHCGEFIGEQAFVGSLKGYAEYLVALLRDPSNETAARDVAWTRAFGWAPVDRELERLAALGPRAQRQMHVQGGGGSGAGFQLLCDGDMLVTAGSGGGGGFDVLLRDGGGADARDVGAGAGARAAARDAAEVGNDDDDGGSAANASAASFLAAGSAANASTNASAASGGGGGGGGVQVSIRLPGGGACELAAGGGSGCGRALDAREPTCGSALDRLETTADGARAARNVSGDVSGCDGALLNSTIRSCAADVTRTLTVTGGGGGEAGFSECCVGPESLVFGFHFELAIGTAPPRAPPLASGRASGPGAASDAPPAQPGAPARTGGPRPPSPWSRFPPQPPLPLHAPPTPSRQRRLTRPPPAPPAPRPPSPPASRARATSALGSPSPLTRFVAPSMAPPAAATSAPSPTLSLPHPAAPQPVTQPAASPADRPRNDTLPPATRAWLAHEAQPGWVWAWSPWWHVWVPMPVPALQRAPSQPPWLARTAVPALPAAAASAQPTPSGATHGLAVPWAASTQPSRSVGPQPAAAWTGDVPSSVAQQPTAPQAVLRASAPNARGDDDDVMHAPLPFMLVLVLALAAVLLAAMLRRSRCPRPVACSRAAATLCSREQAVPWRPSWSRAGHEGRDAHGSGALFEHLLVEDALPA